MNRAPIIVVDGSYASGRHTLGNGLGEAFGLAVISQEQALRLIAFRLHEQKESADDTMAVVRTANRLTDAELLVRPMPDCLRTPEMTDAAFQVAREPEVWPVLTARFRTLAQGARQGAVLVGTAMGRTVCPQAQVRFFMHADRQIRHARETRRYGNFDADPEAELRVDRIDGICVRRLEPEWRLSPMPDYEKRQVTRKADLKTLRYQPEYYFLTDRLDSPAVLDIGRAVVREQFLRLGRN